MPVLETDFLKAIVDPRDRLHSSAEKALKKVKEDDWSVASSALLELDVVLKNEDIDEEERAGLFAALTIEIPSGNIAPLMPSSLSQAAHLQQTYRTIRNFYFDSIHIAVAIQVDGLIVSSDASFDRVREVKRIPLEHL